MNSIFGLMATSGGNFVSIAHLEIPLLIKMLMCQILIFPAVYASVYRCICMDRVYLYMRVFICVYAWIEFICICEYLYVYMHGSSLYVYASVYRCICMD